MFDQLFGKMGGAGGGGSMGGSAANGMMGSMKNMFGMGGPMGGAQGQGANANNPGYYMKGGGIDPMGGVKAQNNMIAGQQNDASGGMMNRSGLGGMLGSAFGRF